MFTHPFCHTTFQGYMLICTCSEKGWESLLHTNFIADLHSF